MNDKKKLARLAVFFLAAIAILLAVIKKDINLLIFCIMGSMIIYYLFYRKKFC